ncbi:hypothetical protein [Archangium sp.]
MLDPFMNAHSVRTAGIGLSLSRNRLGVERDEGLTPRPSPSLPT